MAITPKLSRRKRKAAENRAKFIGELEVASSQALSERIVRPTAENIEKAREAVAQLNRGRRLLGL
ncbi:hypothetical protein ABIC83_002424 [Roseateles asaccharophilus]|uniref:hypothetical protein n=1 Tax=Roseateles asaccharophilus TaxID=582607 RepID=UPI003834B6EE